MPVAGLTPSADSQAPADLVARTARVFTGDRQRPAASAVAIRDGRVLAVSDNVHRADAHRFPAGPVRDRDDRDNQVLVLTGTGDRFMTEIDGQSLDDPAKPAVWDKTTAEGRRIMQRLVDLEMPIVAAVNGPAAVHSEYVLLADIRRARAAGLIVAQVERAGG
jgi:hypothetical protein